MSRVVVVGAGIVGAACAYYCALAGHDVTVVDRGTVSSGTTGSGEGNLLVSDKGPGPELRLAQRSLTLWRELEQVVGRDAIEMEHKGGLVVAPTERALTALRRFADLQRGAGVDCTAVEGTDLRALEPHLSADLAGGVLYPADWQVQPGLAAAELVRHARRMGAVLEQAADVLGPVIRGGRVAGVETSRGAFVADVVVNAAGPWAGVVAQRLGAPLPIAPRRGFVLVTEPLPRVVRHKVYSADYVENVASDGDALETSAVVEGTAGGTVLIGASRELVGFDDRLDVEVVRRLAAHAVRLFPVLGAVDLLRVYHGFRPFSPDHLPVIGHDERLPGVLHATGHEGAGIVLAPATGELVAQLVSGTTSTLRAADYSPDRLRDAA